MRPPFDAADAEDDRVKGREIGIPGATADVPPPAGRVARASWSRTDKEAASTVVSGMARNSGCPGFPTRRCTSWVAPIGSRELRIGLAWSVLGQVGGKVPRI
jgi:hypothetical protein